MMFTSTWCICLLPLLLYQEVSACSCPIDIFRRSREEWICNSYSYSNDVYVATVEAAYCKCQPNNTSNTVFSCIQYSDDGDGVTGSTEETYECTRPSYYYSCSDVTAQATGSEEATVSPTIISPVTNLSNMDYCGQSYFYGSPFYGEANCSILLSDPCIYTIRVGVVYKGNYTTGTILAAVGPDVVTSCGQYGRVLTVGSQYLVGIGGACSRFSEWSEVSQYTESDLAYLQTLRNNTTCDDDDGGRGVLSTGAIVGIVLGVIAAVVLLAAVVIVIVLVCCWACKKTRRKAADVSKYTKQDDDDELIN